MSTTGHLPDPPPAERPEAPTDDHANIVQAELSSFRRYVSAFTDRSGVVAFVTLATFIVAPPPGTFVAARALAFLGMLLLPWIRVDGRFWLTLTLLAGVGTLGHPFLQLDNHHVLQLYWLLAVTLSCFAHDPARSLRYTARLLVGIVFAFATVWKILTPDFVDGSLLTYVTAVDGGVNAVAVAFGLQDPEVAVTNRQAVGELRSHATLPGESVELAVDERLWRAAPTLSVVTLLLEGAVALTFLLPLARRYRWLRDATLLAFLLFTYAVLPVVGFAWLLITMALAQTDLPEDRGSLLYLSAMSLIAVFAARIQIFQALGLPQP